MLVSNKLTFVVDCVWREWIKWGCSTTCGKATREFTRSKLVKEANGGKCVGKATKTEACDVPPCPGNELKLYVRILSDYKKLFIL